MAHSNYTPTYPGPCRFRLLTKEMRVGATEKTFFDCWHPDADKLFNVTSSLRKVCWDLPDPDSRLEDKVHLPHFIG
jgi:hypothetical protein